MNILDCKRPLIFCQNIFILLKKALNIKKYLNHPLIIGSLVAVLAGFFGLYSFGKKLQLVLSKWFKELLDSFQYSDIDLLATILIITIALLLGVLTYLIAKNLKRNQLIKNCGKKFELSELRRKYSALKTVSIVGLANVGKTTLIENLCSVNNENQVTQSKKGYIFRVDNSNNFFAFIDTTGHSKVAQLDLALDSDYLVILLDHNYYHDQINLDYKRLEEHLSFLELLTDRFVQSEFQPSWIHVLINKFDLWGNLDEQEIVKINKFYKTPFDKMERNLDFDNKIIIAPHSNKREISLKELRLKIKEKL